MQKKPLQTVFTRQANIDLPIIAGAMYPCSNPELIAAASEAGAIGIIQPVSLTYVHGYDFREGLQYIKSLTSKPVGMNALIEQSSKRYRKKMEQWLDIALEEGVRFVITSLGKPDWVVERVHAVGGIVYHDATEKKWADKGLEQGVDGLIAVNNRAGGHAGQLSTHELYAQFESYDVPLICAGGIGSEKEFLEALNIGYAGVQMGTRFIATHECNASKAYKSAILSADENDIVHSERITGVPVSVINSPYIQNTSLTASPLVRWLLRGRKTKHLMRTIYALRSFYQLKHSSLDETGKKDYWQAGKSVSTIHDIESVADIIRRFTQSILQNT